VEKAKSVDEYIANAPKEVQSKLNELRMAIKSAAPEAEERISYGMPYYSYHGRLSYFAYFKDHISLFAMPPIPDEYKDKLNITGKSTIQFSFDQKLPIPLIKKLIKTRAGKNAAKMEK
jgi:uncharacterized protein YdhG (YjbR/CyaY superfamily)